MKQQLERFHICHVDYSTNEDNKLTGIYHTGAPGNKSLSLSVSRLQVDIVGANVDIYNFFLHEYEEDRGVLFGLGLYKLVNGTLTLLSGNHTTTAIDDPSALLEALINTADRWSVLDYLGTPIQTERTRRQCDIERLAVLAGYGEGNWVYRTGESTPVYRINDETFDPYNDRTITWQLIARLKIDVSHQSDRMVFTRSDIGVSREVLNMHRCDMGGVICELALKKGK
jgi:hypothetical protein